MNNNEYYLWGSSVVTNDSKDMVLAEVASLHTPESEVSGVLDRSHCQKPKTCLKLAVKCGKMTVGCRMNSVLHHQTPVTGSGVLRVECRPQCIILQIWSEPHLLLFQRVVIYPHETEEVDASFSGLISTWRYLHPLISFKCYFTHLLSSVCSVKRLQTFFSLYNPVLRNDK